MEEVDVSARVRLFIRYGLVSLMALAVMGALFVWRVYEDESSFVIADAYVTGRFVKVRSRAAGTVTEVVAEDRSTVKSGDVLVKMKAKVSDDDIKALETSLAVARQNLARVQSGTTTTVRQRVRGAPPDPAAKAKFERMQRLYEMGAISERELDRAAADYSAAMTEAIDSGRGETDTVTVTTPPSPEALRHAEFAVRQSEAALKAAREESAATEITAPVGGIAYLSDVTAGSEIRPGQPVASIGDSGEMWIEAYTATENSEMFHLGQLVSYSLGGRDLSGVVKDIGEVPVSDGDAPSDRHAGMLKLTITLSPPEGIKPGAMTTVRFSARA